MPVDDPLRLDVQLCFPLYAAARAMTQVYAPLLSKLGLTYPQYLVMLVLWETDGVTVKALGERLYLDSGTLTPLLKRLETQGLVRRERSKEDARSVRVHLTAPGRAHAARATAGPGVAWWEPVRTITPRRAACRLPAWPPCASRASR